MKASVLALAVALAATPALARDVRSIGMSFGDLGNPFFVIIAGNATKEAQKLDSRIQTTVVSTGYDLGKQTNQIDSFIGKGDDVILLSAADPKAIAPTIRRARAAGIVVVAVDVAAEGADATIMTDNRKAGEESCRELVERLGGKGDVVVLNGPQVSSVVDRVGGCESALRQSPGIRIVSDEQNALGTREGGLTVMEGLLTRFSHIDGVFAINDPVAIGADLATRQRHRQEMSIASVDGSPDVEAALKDPDSRIIASPGQDPAFMGRHAVDVGLNIARGNPPATAIELIPPKKLTRDNVSTYKGWNAE